MLGTGNQSEAARFRSAAFLSDLQRHHWPGNIRELRNYIERCLAIHEQLPLPQDSEADADAAYDSALPFKLARDRWTRRFERRYLEDVMRKHDNNRTAAARAAKLDRTYFFRLLQRHGLC